MSKIDVRADLKYEVRFDTVFLFQIAAAHTEHQQVIWEQLEIDPQLNMETYQVGLEGNQLHRLVVQPCELQISYKANVELAPEVNRPTSVGESNTSEMPPEVLTYLNPSRYCQSDLLARFAFEEFGQMSRGYSRVQAICDWVFVQLDYTPGSTNSWTTAADVLLQRTGVCRDYAHLAITLCRGVGIPARYVAGYAVGLQPPDFHGFMEAFLEGQWYLFDPTRLAPVSGLVRIGVGRDAADVSFATLTGDALLIEKTVWANHSDYANPPDSFSGDPPAVSTA
ncbi:transglutaminase-like domain-containing protein [Bythopirellula polymerisocia]|uniref:Transglutaminase-like superfamily protein n=1 Tax=Bythopirellula polymerisocia TaxID=2528003 RepID=A0A5C6CH51_9BACT|nr:transglutaminase family protein [Bythopirellula polymerisocia]TWU23678.1 Transglutaminase-like superfamily protein [Bythopirellula polymerisocia]